MSQVNIAGQRTRGAGRRKTVFVRERVMYTLAIDIISPPYNQPDSDIHVTQLCKHDKRSFVTVFLMNRAGEMRR